MKESGAIQLASSGKMAGCWIMPWSKEVKNEKEAKETSVEAVDPYEADTSVEQEDQAKIMGGNLARLMNVDDAKVA